MAFFVTKPIKPCRAGWKAILAPSAELAYTIC
jgi:hypothetical protein